MMVCRVPYCDCAVWTEKELVVERIATDSDFHQSMIDAVKKFFVYGGLPEIVRSGTQGSLLPISYY